MPRPATEVHSGSLDPGRPSRARSAHTCHAAGWLHTPPTDRMYGVATDVRQHHRLMPLGGGIINKAPLNKASYHPTIQLGLKKIIEICK